MACLLCKTQTQLEFCNSLCNQVYDLIAGKRQREGEEEKEEEEETVSLTDVPLEIFLNILYRVPLGQLGRICSTNESIRYLCRDPNFMRGYLFFNENKLDAMYFDLLLNTPPLFETFFRWIAFGMTIDTLKYRPSYPLIDRLDWELAYLAENVNQYEMFKEYAIRAMDMQIWDPAMGSKRSFLAARNVRNVKAIALLIPMMDDDTLERALFNITNTYIRMPSSFPLSYIRDARAIIRRLFYSGRITLAGQHGQGMFILTCLAEAGFADELEMGLNYAKSPDVVDELENDNGRLLILEKAASSKNNECLVVLLSEQHAPDYLPFITPAVFSEAVRHHNHDVVKYLLEVVEDSETDYGLFIHRYGPTYLRVALEERDEKMAWLLFNDERFPVLTEAERRIFVDMARKISKDLAHVIANS